MKKILLILLVNISCYHFTAAQTLDQNITGSIGSGWLVNSGSYTTLGQSFTAGLNGFLRRVDINLDANNSTYPLIAGSFSITIRSGNGYTGTILGVDTFTILGTEPSGYFTINIKPNTVPMVSGNSYTFIIDEISGTGQIMMNATSNVYSGGDLYWQVFTNSPNLDASRDFICRTYVQSSCTTTTSTISKTSFCSYTVPSRHETYTATGTYTDTIPNAGGCDSIITINLTIDSIINQTIINPSNSICKSEPRSVNLNSSQTGVTYFLRDNNTDTIIQTLPGTGSIFTLTTDSIFSNRTYNVYATAPSAGPSIGLDFDGTDDYVIAPTSVNLVNNSFTIEAWAKRTSNGADHYIVSQGASNTNQGLHFGFRSSNVFTLAFWSNDVNTTQAYTDNKWHHWAATYDAVTKDQKIYRDGILVATRVAPANYTGTGALNIARTFNNNGFFVGSIDDVRIWNVARSASQIQNYKDSCLSGAETGLVAYYKFEDGTGSSTLTDASSNKNNGNLTNMNPNNDWVTGINNCANCNLELTPLVNFTLNTATTSTINPSACFSYTSPSGKIFTVSSTYIDTIPNANSCDSIITINLTVNTVDTSVTVNAPTFTANATGATYQWINCANNQPISGANGKSFTATSVGNYAVIVTQNGCTDTSACYSAGNVGIETLSSNNVRVYPNPTSGIINLELKENQSYGYQLSSIDGKLIEEKKNILQNKVLLDLGNQPNGLYILKLYNSNSVLNIKINKN